MDTKISPPARRSQICNLPVIRSFRVSGVSGVPFVLSKPKCLAAPGKLFSVIHVTVIF